MAKASKRAPSRGRRQRTRASQQARPSRAQVETAQTPIGSVVVWTEIPAMVRALGETARRPSDFAALERLMLGLTEPLRQLESLAELAERGLGGDLHATRDLQGRLAALAARGPGVRELDAALIGRKHHDKCGCGCPETTAVGPSRDAIDAARDQPAVIDQRAATALLLAVARLHSDQPPVVRDDALAATVTIAAAACTIGGLVAAHRSGGKDGLVNTLNRLAGEGRLGWAGMPMQTMSGGGPAGFDVPSLPSKLPMPGGNIPLPGGDIPLPGGGDIPLPGRHPLDELLGFLKKRKVWDPEIWDHPYAFWRDPLNYIDRDMIALIACMIALRHKLQDRAAILPPARPARVTWADGITSITGGSCVGDQIVIRGSGLLAPNTFLLLPFADGCHVVPVPAGNWTDTTITLSLPAGVVSGPIGFGDQAYIIAYDTWALQQNILAAEIEGIWCYPGDLPWIPPFRECPPDIGVNHLRAGSAIITSFTAAGAASTTVEPGGAVLLAWTVKNAEHVRIDRIGPSGPAFPGGSTALIDPAGTTWTLWPFTHTQPVTCTYRLTATGPCGAVTRDVTIFASKRPYLWIQGIEVTQSIQTTANNVALVQSKPTVVRVTVRHGLNGFDTNAVAGVKGRIRVHRNDGSQSGWIDAANGSTPMGPSPGASITVVANPQRNNTNDTLNFLIPPAWCTALVTYEIEARVTGYGKTAGFAGFDQSTKFNSGWFNFQARRTLELRYIRVNWGGSTPTAQVCFDTLRTAIPLLPTPTANISALAGVGVQNPSGTANSDRDDLLDDFDDLHNCSWWEALWEWLGEDCPDDDGAIWALIPGVFFRGRAYDIPSNVCFTPPSNGPYAAHELSHCLNQPHVSVACANGQTATGGDAPGAFPNNAQLVDVPFDVTRNLALTLSGTGVFDVMTYCGTPNNTWPMPVRWTRLWNEIG
jgi:hypothetical protein